MDQPAKMNSFEPKERRSEFIDQDTRSIANAGIV